MEWLQTLLENSQFPALTAFILGLMTAISPCPLATNITAVGYIGKDLEDKRRVFYNGLIYTLGRAITYVVIGLVFYLGASQFKVSGFIQHWGERMLGPLLIVIGIFMLGLIRIAIPGMGRLSERMGKNAHKSFWDVLLLGIVFALAFCPYSGVLYFGMLIPLTITSASGLFLPLIFAVATGLPVILVAWLIAYSISGVGKFYSNVKLFEFWFRRIVAVVFILVGLYYSYIFYF
jgi:sulfite exporter TauE/SafE